MTQSTIAADVHQSLDVHLDPFSEVTFNLALSFQDCSYSAQFVFIKITDPRVKVDVRFPQNRLSPRATDTIDVCETNFSSLIRRKIYASYTCHFCLYSRKNFE